MFKFHVFVHCKGFLFSMHQSFVFVLTIEKKCSLSLYIYVSCDS
uniref:Uncharacterized protein n=1 Tax=Arundo donax TaxID=35708 RepID=A0A0A9CRW6_ARUDO